MMRSSNLKVRVSGAALSLALVSGAAHAQTADQTAAKPADSTVVVVTGVKASLRSAVATKKNAQEIVDSISAEDIGKLPDTNVSETLTRIPGVQGYRYGGEGASPVGNGSGLTIRGLSGQTASQVDGRAYSTAGEREFNIEDAIPSMVAGVDVYKNPSAEHIEGGIGGLVNIRTRHPSDFKGPTFTISVGEHYNDLDNHFKPEIFGLLADKWDLPNGGRLGLMIAGTYQRAQARSDNTPANGGANYYAVVPSTDANFTADGGVAAYAGQANTSVLVPVPTTAVNYGTGHGSYVPNPGALSGYQIISAPALSQTPAGEEIIKRTRKGLDIAADYVSPDGLRLYAEFNYTYYLYNQNYLYFGAPNSTYLNAGSLATTGSLTVQNLQLTPFTIDSNIANRNVAGGAVQTYSTQRLAGGTFMNAVVNTTGGEEYHPYSTWISALGFEYNPAGSKWSFKGDLSVIGSEVDDDNRSVTLSPAAGAAFNLTRNLTGAPHTLTLAPGSSDPNNPANWVFNTYNDGTNNITKDQGYAAKADAVYRFDHGFLKDIKFGGRYAHTEDRFWNYGLTANANLTTDGKALAANYSNAVSVLSDLDLVTNAQRNIMGGKVGYSGGQVVFAPWELLGNIVANRFPLAGIPMDGSHPEQLLSRRFESENTAAAYVMADFTALDDKLKGNAGVRIVKTDELAIGYINTLTPPVYPVPNRVTQSYSNVLPTVNLTYYITPDFLARVGYGKAMTRPSFGDLNPVISVNSTNGTGSAGNPYLAPLKADSYDLSLERYFNRTDYASIDFFDKQLNGFQYTLADCETVANAPTPLATQVGCASTQYQISRTTNAGNGYARGVEMAYQTFFDFLPGAWQHFGAQASFTYVDALNPVNFGSGAQPAIYKEPLPFVSKYNYTLQAFYDDQVWSARLVWTWRSNEIFSGISASPLDGRYIAAYGILDGSINYNLNKQVTLTFNGSNMLNRGLNRYVGEPAYPTGIERQHYDNGRAWTISARYKFGG